MNTAMIGKWAFIVGLVIAVLCRACLSTRLGDLGAGDPGCDCRLSQCHRRRYARLFVGFDCVNSFRDGAKYFAHRGDGFFISTAGCGSLCRWCDDRGRIKRTVRNRP